MSALKQDYGTDIIAKESFVSQHNMTMQDFINGNYPDSLFDVEFVEFKNAPFFILGKDYDISIYDDDYDDYLILKEGNNTINEIEVNACICTSMTKYHF